MLADSLRKSILQAAIEGKLTEREPGDGDARDLLNEDVRATVHPAGDATTSVEYHTPTIVEGGFGFRGGTWRYSCKKDNEVSFPLVNIPSGKADWAKMQELFNDNSAILPLISYQNDERSLISFDEAKQPDGALDYENMLGTCDGGRTIERADWADGRHILCCDAAKGNREITINPYDKSQMDKIRYSEDGRIYTHPRDETLERDINDILHLNGRDGLDTSTGLLHVCGIVMENLVGGAVPTGG